MLSEEGGFACLVGGVVGGAVVSRTGIVCCGCLMGLWGNAVVSRRGVACCGCLIGVWGDSCFVRGVCLLWLLRGVVG